MGVAEYASTYPQPGLRKPWASRRRSYIHDHPLTDGCLPISAHLQKRVNGHQWPSREHLLSNLLECRQGCIAQCGREPDDHPIGASLCKPLQRLRVAGLAKDCDVYGTGVTS